MIDVKACSTGTRLFTDKFTAYGEGWGEGGREKVQNLGFFGGKSDQIGPYRCRSSGLSWSLKITKIVKRKGRCLKKVVPAVRKSNIAVIF